MFYLRCPLCGYWNEVAETAVDNRLPPIGECEVCGEVFDADPKQSAAESPES